MYYLKKDRFGNHVLNKEGERLYAKLIVKPPRQHGRKKTSTRFGKAHTETLF